MTAPCIHCGQELRTAVGETRPECGTGPCATKRRVREFTSNPRYAERLADDLLRPECREAKENWHRSSIERFLP